jgi:hypothetical protein
MVVSMMFVLLWSGMAADVCGGKLIASVAAVLVRRARRSKFFEFK